MGSRMPFPAATPVEDRSELRSRVQSIEVGARLMLTAAIAALSYAFGTGRESHRTAVVVVILGGTGLAPVPLLIGPERIVRGGLREPFFLGWSVSTIALVAALVVA